MQNIKEVFSLIQKQSEPKLGVTILLSFEDFYKNPKIQAFFPIEWMKKRIERVQMELEDEKIKSLNIQATDDNNSLNYEVSFIVEDEAKALAFSSEAVLEETLHRIINKVRIQASSSPLLDKILPNQNLLVVAPLKIKLDAKLEGGNSITFAKLFPRMSREEV